MFDNDNQLNQRWFVYYFFMHPETGKMQRFRIFISAKLLTKVARRRKGEEIITAINTKLKRGWNPFTSEQLKLTTVSEALDHVMKIKSATICKRSIWTYNSVIRHLYTY